MVNRNEPGTRVTEMSIVSISVFAAICLALMAVLMTRPDFEVGLNTYCLASGALLLAILFFIFASDFFLLMIFYPENQIFGITGSGLYGLGEALMVVGIALALKALAVSLIGYLFLAIFTLGFLAYNGIRLWQVGLESPVRIRIMLRAVNFVILVIGYVIIWRIQRRKENKQKCLMDRPKGELKNLDHRGGHRRLSNHGLSQARNNYQRMLLSVCLA